jgi:cell division initiation protein
MEIRNQQFSRSVRGYSTVEVNNFLQQLAQDYEDLYSDNATLRETIQRLEYELQKYRRMEETMNNSLILAQQTAEEVKVNARREAAIILRESKAKIAEVLAVYQEVIKRVSVLTTEVKGQIHGQLELLEKSQKRVDELADFFYGKDLKEMLESLEEIDDKELSL